MTPLTYCIRIKGHLPAGWSDLLEGMQICQEPGGDSLLTGPLADQAALYGLLARLQNLGITLISINPLEKTS